MIISVPLYLRDKHSFHTVDEDFASNDRIIKAFDSIGIRPSPRIDQDGKSATVYTMQAIEVGRSVAVGSVLHHRDLMMRNGRVLKSERHIAEFERYGIYFGTIPSRKAMVFASRVSDAEVSIVIYQKDISVLHKCTEAFFDDVLKLSIFPDRANLQNHVHVSSSSAGAEIANGILMTKSLSGLMFYKRKETVALVFSLVLLAVSASLSLMPVQENELLGMVVEGAKEIWRIALGSVLSILLLFVVYYSTQRRHFLVFPE